MKPLAEHNILHTDGRVRLIADKGMICTDDKTNYGIDITLEEGLGFEGFHQIPMEEYRAKLRAEAELAEQEEQMI